MPLPREQGAQRTSAVGEVLLEELAQQALVRAQARVVERRRHLASKPSADRIARRRRQQARPRRLSVAAMETLAIIGYRQPVGRAEIEEIRGVAVDGVLRLLQERGLIDVVGRGEGLGRPLLYGTTPAFLELLGLKALSDLPRLGDLSVALKPLTEEVAGE